MSRKNFFSIVFFICSYLLTFIPLSAQEQEGEIIIISERVGKEIDQAERDKFKLFERINGFQSAVYIKLPDGRYFLKTTYRDDKTGEIKISRTLQSEASIKSRGNYIDHFEEIQAEKQQSQSLLKPQTLSSDSGKIQAHQGTAYQEPGTAWFVELLGKPWTSINVDFRINKSSRFSLGATFYYHYEEEDDDVASFMPSIMYYYLRGKKNKRFEIGGGLSVLPVWHKDVNYDFPIAFHFVIGYRYQKKDGLLFRIGLTRNIYPDLDLFFLGIGFGYSL